ncbi:hypothetical protein [Amycolatopsis samaneae]|uniref:Zinc finger CHCC-type domain-containing protein n=1 Tax=Amycolatopsis samaneae TaxID=664691 RepID=A0ABW5GVG6_9PSEU
MNALIYLDLAHVLPVVDGIWHRIILSRVPLPGEPITMLCGLSSVAAYDDTSNREIHLVPRQCWDCEKVYRLRNGYDPPPSGYRWPAR